MYTSFFGLNEKPFSITPDPRYLFMSERHGEALAHLVYGVTESGGFIQLTGEVGTGKTTLVRTLLANRLPEHADVAVVLNPQLSAKEFLATIVEELSVPGNVDHDSMKSLTDSLNRYLLEAHGEGRRVILIVDEAQNLSPKVLEQVRLLTNLETARQKLLQIILIGQPELRELLARNDLRQLAQRITGRYHLEPLSRTETDAYIRHRLKVAGAVSEIFDTAAIREVFRLSQGVPRLINVICDRALLGAYARESRRVTRSIVRRAAAEIAGEEDISMWRRRLVPAFGVLGTLIVAAGFAWMYYLQPVAGPVADSSPAAYEKIVDANAAVDTAPQPAVPPAPALGDRLGSETSSEDAAWNELLSVWGLPDTVADCAAASALGFDCVRQRGSFGSLRQLDRPAVLTLVDASGSSHFVLLKSLGPDLALLSVAGQEVRHSITEISEFWFGDFLLLWQPPNGRALALLPGVDDPNVVWLRQSLEAVDPRYAAEPTDSSVYDAELARKVRAFQRDHRLDVDGYAGSQTQIILNGLLAPGDIPRLSTPRLARD